MVDHEPEPEPGESLPAPGKGTIERVPGENGKLGDIAPTILTLMQLPIPKEMTGNILIN